MPQETQKRKKKICVVIDTNVWRSSLLLKDSIGSALLYWLNVSGGKLGLPEIIESEIHKQLVKAGMEAVQEIEKGFRAIGSIVGVHRPYEVPDEEQLAAAVEKRLAELDDLFVRVPITLEHTRSALERVNAELPPNSPRNEQFKDSMIWEAVLQLGRSFIVHLVTKDRGFYKGKSYEEMAAKLRAEIQNAGIEVHVHSELAGCLEVLRDVAPPLDYEALAVAIDRKFRVQLRKYAGEQGLDVAEMRSHRIRAFYTEKHEILALDFSETTKSAFDARLDHIKYKWTDITGKEQMGRSVFLIAASGYIGRPPDVPYTIKLPIPEE